MMRVNLKTSFEYSNSKKVNYKLKKLIIIVIEYEKLIYVWQSNGRKVGPRPKRIWSVFCVVVGLVRIGPRKGPIYLNQWMWFLSPTTTGKNKIAKDETNMDRF